MLPIAAKIGLRYSKTSNKRSFVSFINMFSVVGIALGIASLITVISVMNGLEGQLKQKILGIVPHVVVDTRQLPPLSETAQRKIVFSSDFVEQEIILQSSNTIKGVILQGIDVDKEKSQSVIANAMVSGKWESMSKGSFKVVISRSLANKLRVSVGEQLRVISPSASVFTPLGRMPSQRLVVVSGLFQLDSEADDSVVLMNIDDVAKLSRQRNIDFASKRLYLKDAFDFKTVTDELSSYGIDFRTWRERQGPLFDAVSMEKAMMSLMLLLIIAVAAFNIVSALVMVVSEKTADIAILQTQGLLPKDVMLIFILNGIFNGFKGILAGVVLGLLLVWNLNDILRLLGSPLAFGPNGTGLPIDLRLVEILYISLGSLVLCVGATLYPAFKAASINPANSLQAQ
ncbi:lipoprotein-releasing ABC transporter permease subunit [Glaciecola sp. MH2013]|nr:lipoprotein-releasing ABC transporter permease subunit [Glaciecola sp. MH2013]